MIDPTDIRAEEARSEAAKAANETLSELEKNDLVWLMSQARGRRFIWRLLSKAGVFQSSFTGNSATFFNEGRRDVGLWALASITAHCPEDFVKMLTEQKEYRK